MTVEGGEKLCDESDVVMHYRIIVGRDPESAAVIEAAKRQPLTRFVRSGFLSGEFQDNVIFKLANGRPLPHERISARPTLDQISWLIQHLELGPDTLKNLDSVDRGRIYFDSSLLTSISGGSSRLCAIRTSCKNCLAGFSGSVFPRWKNPRDWSRRFRNVTAATGTCQATWLS